MLRLDKHNLDQFLEEFPQVFDEISQQVASAQELVDRLKQELDELKATLSLSFREDLLRQGQRVTEKLIEDLITIDEDFINKKKELLQAQAELVKLKATKEALTRALEAAAELSRLYVAGYWGVSNVTRTERKIQRGV